MKISVVIVNYNVKYYVGQCIDSVRRALRGIDSEIIVVDNHSRDGSVDYLSKIEGVRIIESGHNLGFSKANNIAIRQSTAEYVLMLNPDTIVAEDAIRMIIDFADSHPQAGGIGVRMLSVPDYSKATVVVIGDVMLDRYFAGPALRISPEAPVPVVRIDHREVAAREVAGDVPCIVYTLQCHHFCAKFFAYPVHVLLIFVRIEGAGRVNQDTAYAITLRTLRLARSTWVFSKDLR